MKRYPFFAFVSVIIIVVSLTVSAVGSAEDAIYGYQLMTEQERAEHRAKMRSFRTEQEREAYRRQHHQMMQERAKAQGTTLPDEPMPRGQGRRMGPEKGQGRRMGQGRS